MSSSTEKSFPSRLRLWCVASIAFFFDVVFVHTADDDKLMPTQKVMRVEGVEEEDLSNAARRM